MGLRKLPARGTIYRPHFDNENEFRSIVATGGNSAATSVADGASATLTFSSCQEKGILERFFLQGNAPTALLPSAGVAMGAPSAGLLGWAVSSAKVANDELIGGGYVPATLFAYDSVHNPRVGKPIDSNDAITVGVTNNSGATAEITVGATVA